MSLPTFNWVAFAEKRRCWTFSRRGIVPRRLRGPLGRRLNEADWYASMRAGAAKHCGSRNLLTGAALVAKSGWPFDLFNNTDGVVFGLNPSAIPCGIDLRHFGAVQENHRGVVDPY